MTTGQCLQETETAAGPLSLSLSLSLATSLVVTGHIPLRRWCRDPGGLNTGQTQLFIDNNPPTVYNEQTEAGLVFVLIKSSAG